MTALGAPTAKEHERILAEKKSLEEQLEQLNLQNQELVAKARTNKLIRFHALTALFHSSMEGFRCRVHVEG